MQTDLKNFTICPNLECMDWIEVIIFFTLNVIVGISCLELATNNDCPGSHKLIIYLIVCGSIRLCKVAINTFHLIKYASWNMGIFLEGIFELFFMLFSVTYGAITLKNQWEYNVLIENNTPGFTQDNYGCNQGIYVLSWCIVVWNILLLIRLSWRLQRWCVKRYNEASGIETEGKKLDNKRQPLQQEGQKEGKENQV